MRAFQARRGLRVDGLCGPQTRAALEEARRRPGERLLYLRSPMLRGDDVADLQRRLGALGFDAGRVDGIFGKDTARALEEFQHNAGVTTDGICGPATIQALERLGHCSGEPVAALRERDELRRAPRTLQGRRVVVGHEGLAGLAAAIGRALAEAGAEPLVLSAATSPELAAEANARGAEVVASLRVGPHCAVAYYRVPGFVSFGGRHLARRLAPGLAAVLGRDCCPLGMSLPVLRETKMPAVAVEFPADAPLEARAPELAAAFATALHAWATEPADETVPLDEAVPADEAGS